MDIINVLVKNLVEVQYENLPTEAVEYTKKAVLDTLGTMIGGSGKLGCDIVLYLVKDWGGKPESTILVHGGKVPVHNAALVNGTMGRALDYDDVHEEAEHHPSVNLVPAAFAMAEREGSLTGKELITAIALGADLTCRLGLSLNAKVTITGHHDIFRIFGPAAVAGKILKLDEEKMLACMGLAFAHATAIELQSFVDGGLTVRLGEGQVAQAGIVAALLAQRGFTGPKNVLQGKYGYYTAYEPSYNPEFLTRDLGRRFEGAYSSLKPYPACKATHTAITGVLDIVSGSDINPNDIEEISIGLSEISRRFISEPLEVRLNPQSEVDRQFSLQYGAAVAAAKRRFMIADLTQNTGGDAQVLKMIKRVEVHSEDKFSQYGVISPAAITIKTKEGREYTNEVYYALGHPNNPASWEQVVDKFRDCLSESARPLPEGNVKQVIDMVANLEDLPDVSTIPSMLTADE